MKYYIEKIKVFGVAPTLETNPKKAYEIFMVVDLISENGKKVKDYEVVLGYTDLKNGEKLEELDEKYNLSQMADVELVMMEHNYGGKIPYSRKILKEIASRVIDAAKSRASGHMTGGLSILSGQSDSRLVDLDEIASIYKNISDDMGFLIKAMRLAVHKSEEFREPLWREMKSVYKAFLNRFHSMNYIMNQYIKERNPYLCKSPLNELKRLYNDVKTEIGKWRMLRKQTWRIYHNTDEEINKLMKVVEKDIPSLEEIYEKYGKYVKYSC